MLRLGLTGGIASGKSAVAAMLREMGFAVLDADSLAHRLIERGQPAHDEILREFGPAITDASGSINRAELANVVFADRAKLDRLNAIVHPRVADVVFRQLDEWERNGVRDAAFVEAALLIEAGLEARAATRTPGCARPYGGGGPPPHRGPAFRRGKTASRYGENRLLGLARRNPPAGCGARLQAPPPNGAMTALQFFLYHGHGMNQKGPQP